jgi:hypothetical protein
MLIFHKMATRCYRVIFLLLWLTTYLGFVTPDSSHAQNAIIEDFFVNNSETHLLLYMTVQDCFTEEMITGINNGIPATFTFYVDLYRTKKAWPDRKMISHVFNRTINYDTLKEEYSIISSENTKNMTTKSLAQGKTLMSRLSDYKIIPLNQLDSDVTYKVRVKVKLAKKTLPLYFHYLIPFSSLWDFETKWHTLEFRL